LESARIAWPGFLATIGPVLTTWLARGIGLAWHWRRRPGEARLAPTLAICYQAGDWSGAVAAC
jgi:hypothetical protein